MVKCLNSDDEGNPCQGIFKANPPRKNYKCASCGYEIDRQTYLSLAEAINEDQETGSQLRDLEMRRATAEDKQGPTDE